MAVLSHDGLPCRLPPGAGHVIWKFHLLDRRRALFVCSAIMATLTRLRPPAATTQLEVLYDKVPTPFPTDLLQQERRKQQSVHEPFPAHQDAVERPPLVEESSTEDVHLATEDSTPIYETEACLPREMNVSPPKVARRLLTLQADLGRTLVIPLLRPAVLSNDPQQAHLRQRGGCVLATNPSQPPSLDAFTCTCRQQSD